MAVYRGMKKRDDLLSTVMYLVVLQVVIDSFIRWQMGTFTYVMEFLFALYGKYGRQIYAPVYHRIFQYKYYRPHAPFAR